MVIPNGFQRSALALCVVCCQTWQNAGAEDGHNYAEALQKCLYFYEAQEAGPLSLENRVEFRGPTATLRDGSDVGRDLSGGWYDAGDNVKRTNNDAFGATMLAWALMNYRQEFRGIHQYDRALRNLRHGTDFLLRCVHADSPTGFRIYVGIGNKGTAADYQGDDPVYPGDHGAIAAIAEWMDVPQTKRVVDGVALPGSVRPSYWVDDSTGGPDTGASVAAALAATSIVFRQAGDTAYADELLSVAKAADAFANRLPQGSTRTRRLTEGRIVDLPSYPSRSAASARFRIWSAAWLYRADEAAGASDPSSVHLDRARAIYDSADAKDLGNPWDVFSVGSPANGAYTMLAAVTGTQPWVDRARAYCDFWLYRRSNQTGMSTDITTTPGGFVCRGNGASWNIHFLMDASPPMLEWADSPHNTDAERKAHLEALFTGTFSKEGIDYPLCPVPQLDYILGDNPLGMSYLQGYAKPGASWVDNLHYRSTWGMYGGFGTPEADWPGRNIFPTYGLLAPGPDHTDFYPRSTDLPTSIIGHQEPIIYSGGILTALARKIRLEGANAGEALGVFPEWITPAANERTSRYFVQAIRRSDSAPPVDQGIRVLTTLENRNFIEPQQRNQLGFRVYFTLDNGAQLDDIKIVGFWADTHGEWSGPFAAGGNLAYFTIRFPNDYIGPGEWRNHSRKAEFTIQARQPGLWDSSNDPSFAGLATQIGSGAPQAAWSAMPVYDFSAARPKCLGGEEPGAGYVRWRRARFNNTWEHAGTVTVYAERLGGSLGAVSAQVAISEATASRDFDFTVPEDLELSWAAGEQGAKALSIPIAKDGFTESTEEFDIRLHALTGGLQPGARIEATVTISDSDPDGRDDRHSLRYQAGEGGTILGEGAQVVHHGRDAASVEAIAGPGWVFVAWSDGRSDNPRQDVDVAGDLQVRALFQRQDRSVALSAINGYLWYALERAGTPAYRNAGTQIFADRPRSQDLSLTVMPGQDN